jgi:hypothetical protein
VPGEDEDQLVTDSYRFINACPYFSSDGEIFWCIEAPYSIVLQIRVEAFSKGLILARVAKETIKLHWLGEQGGQIVNQRIWQATAPEKGQRERPGFGEGAMVEGARATMAAGL